MDRGSCGITSPRQRSLPHFVEKTNPQLARRSVPTLPPERFLPVVGALAHARRSAVALVPVGPTSPPATISSMTGGTGKSAILSAFCYRPIIHIVIGLLLLIQLCPPFQAFIAAECSRAHVPSHTAPLFPGPVQQITG